MTASPQVLAVIAGSGLPIEGQAFVAAVVAGETPQNEGPGYSPWNILYSGAGDLTGKAGLVDPSDSASILMVGKWRYWIPPLSTFPAWHGGKLATGNFSTAAGGPQITGTTFRGNGFGITGFDPQSQTVFAWKLGQLVVAAHTSRSLLSILQGTDSDRLLVSAYLGPTWLGGCDTGFPKRYASNLAALQALATEPVPVAPPTPTATPETLTVSIADQAGRKGTATVVLSSVAGAALVGVIGMAMAGMIGIAVVKGPRPTAQPVQPVAQTTLPEPDATEVGEWDRLPPAAGASRSAGGSWCSPKDLRRLLRNSPCAAATDSGR